jgi:phage gpG-like protein
MATIVTKGDEGIIKALLKISALATEPDTLARIGAIVRDESKASFTKRQEPQSGQAWPGPNWYQDGQLMEDSGKLKRSIRVVLHPPYAVEVGTDDPRAALLGEGGVVRPKTAKVLVIPIDRDVAHRVKAAGGWRQAYDDAYIINPKGGDTKALLVSRMDGVVGVLRDSVVIPRRRFLGVSMDARRKIWAHLDHRIKAIWNITDGGA